MSEIFSGQWNSNRLINHWNGVAKHIDDISKAYSTGIYRRSEIDLITKHFKPLKGKKLLKLDLWNEVNNTRILSYLASKGSRVSGLDISTYLVSKTKENFKKAKLKGQFIACDMRDMKVKDNYFDYVYTMGTIEHVYDYHVAIREIYRVLKPGGRAIIGVPNKLDPFLRPLLVRFLDIFGLYAYSPEKSFTRFELNLMLKSVGFNIIKDSGVLFVPGVLRIADLFIFKYLPFMQFSTKPLLKMFEALERKYDWTKRNGYLICAIVEKPKILKKAIFY